MIAAVATVLTTTPDSGCVAMAFVLWISASYLRRAGTPKGGEDATGGTSVPHPLHFGLCCDCSLWISALWRRRPGGRPRKL